MDKSSYGIYAGFDPTASDLHIGHLPILCALKLFGNQRHPIYLLVGDATSKIGDPSFRSNIRLQKHDQNELSNKFTQNLPLVFEKILGRKTGFTILHNSNWHAKISVLAFLETIASKFKVSDLIKKEFIKDRLKNGMNFAEFAYPLMQAYDFFYLFEAYNCRIQIGGSDQWGNITAGTEIINSIYGRETALGLTINLLSCKNGKKMGKSSGNAIWITGEKASPIKIIQALKNQSSNVLFQFAFDSKDPLQSLISAIFDGTNILFTIESTYDICSKLLLNRGDFTVTEYAKVFSQSQIVKAPPTIKVIELISKLYNREKSNNELRKLVIDGQIEIGSVKPRNPLIKLSEFVNCEKTIVKERDTIIGLYIKDLQSENSLKPKMADELCA